MEAKEIQSIDSLTEKEMNIYQNAKTLQEIIKSNKTIAVLSEIVAIGEMTYAAVSSYVAQTQNMPIDDKQYPIIAGLIGITGIIVHGIYRRAQGQKERELYDIVNKKEYKKAEKFMNKEYTK